MQNPSPRSKLLPKMTEGSTDSLSVQRYNATCPWNPVLSISFVFSIRHDQLSFLLSCAFICYLIEGIADMKDTTTLPFITMTSSLWLHLRTYLIKMIWCILRQNPMHHSCCWGEFNQKPSLDIKVWVIIRGSGASAMIIIWRQCACFCLPKLSLIWF